MDTSGVLEILRRLLELLFLLGQIILVWRKIKRTTGHGSRRRR